MLVDTSFRLLRLFLAIAIVLWPNPMVAHEGHKPLPTKGVEVQAQTGTLVLSASARDAIEVKTEEIQPRTLDSYLSAYGTLTVPWNNHALVGSSIEGRVVSVLAIAGDTVKSGQTVAQIESPVIEQLQRDIRDLIISIGLDRQLLQGSQEASKSGSIPAARVLELQTSLFQKETSLKLAKAKWLGLGLSSEDLERIIANPETYQRVRLGLQSPIDATVLHNDLTIGKYVGLKEHVLELIDLSKLWLKIEILEKDISKVHSGDPVEFLPSGQPSNSIAGSIRLIEKVLDPRTHVATAWVDLDTPDLKSHPLLPGMTGQVRIGRLNPEPKLLVPSSAVVRDGAERFVLVEQERNDKASVFKKISLAIGLQSGGYCEVSRGELVPGDRVLTQGSRQLGRLFTQGVLRLSPEAIQDIGLKTAIAKSQVVSKTLSLDGVVSLPPSKLARVSGQLGGRIHQILIDRGATLRSGDPMALIASPQFQDLQLQAIQASLQKKFRESVLTNIRQAGTSIPQRQRLESETQLVSARIQYEAAFEQLRLLGLTAEQIDAIVESGRLMQYYPVLAPIDGVVVGFSKAIGHVVSADEELFELHDTSQRLIEAFVSEKDAPAIRPGQRLRCKPVAQDHRIYTGVVISSGQSLSNKGQTLSVWAKVDFEQDSVVFHNMLCRLTIELLDDDGQQASTEMMPVVPLSSVLQEGNQSYIFVALTDGTFERRSVSLGRSDDSHVVVLSGLSDRETVVTQGVSALQTGYAAVQ